MAVRSSVDVDAAVVAAIASKGGALTEEQRWADASVARAVVAHIDGFAGGAPARGDAARLAVTDAQNKMRDLYREVVPESSRRTLVMPAAYDRQAHLADARVLVVGATPSQKDADRGVFVPDGALMGFCTYLADHGVAPASMAVAAVVPFHPGHAWGEDSYNKDRPNLVPPKAIERVFLVYFHRMVQCMRALDWVVVTSREAARVVLAALEIGGANAAGLKTHIRANTDPKKRAFRRVMTRLDVDNVMHHVTLGGRTVSVLRLLSPWAFAHDESGEKQRKAEASVAALVAALAIETRELSAVERFFGASSAAASDDAPEAKRPCVPPAGVYVSDFQNLFLACATPSAANLAALAGDRFTVLVNMSNAPLTPLLRGRDALFAPPPDYWKEEDLAKRFTPAVLMKWCGAAVGAWAKRLGVVAFSERATLVAPALLGCAILLFMNPDMLLEETLAWGRATFGDGAITDGTRAALFGMFGALCAGPRRTFASTEADGAFVVRVFNPLVRPHTHHRVGAFATRLCAFWYAARLNRMLAAVGARPEGPVVDLDGQHAYVLPHGETRVAAIMRGGAAVSGYGMETLARKTVEKHAGEGAPAEVVVTDLAEGQPWGADEFAAFKRSAEPPP